MMALRLADRPASAGSYANNLREFESVREFMTSVQFYLVFSRFYLFFIIIYNRYFLSLAVSWQLCRPSSYRL